ncbi:glycoside hydrolase N-terminal domain-containing protein [Flammeovirga sp. SJP92]|uniref:glycoside hydrolase family 95 protein n=1 Tax=Flammeovirga sp. SJP92 TaxID=1775430 RepID=UPI00078753B9|nr:glycoside hydrolase family 95 protein [Flammeovirga sp. SJP92]KXX71291.1 alpha-L-fucosidase [Flammeovirga sp. SJP92]
MKQTKQTLLISFLLLFSACSTSLEEEEDLLLSYNHPATTWTEALPIGNGRQGAMIYGGALEEHYQLNENTLYSGEPSSNYKGTNIQPTFQEVRELINAQQYKEAEKIMAKEWLGRLHQSYQPFADLKFNFGEGEISNYKRDLNISEAISHVSYQKEGVEYKRETLASHPNQVIAIKLSASQRKSINFKTHFEAVHPQCKVEVEGNTLIFKGQAPGFVLRRTLENVERNGDDHKYPEIYNADGSRKEIAKQVLYGNEVDGKGMWFEARLEVRNQGGEITSTSKGLSVTGADEVVLLLAMSTSFNGFDRSPSRNGINPSALNRTTLRHLSNKTFEEIKKTHCKDYKNLFDRVSFQLESDVDSKGKTTKHRLEEYATNHDPALNALLFQYGRYLMISGSRKGGQPLNLQGIWNDMQIPFWNSAYTMNINAQMNYWPAEVTNLSECHEPIFRLTKELAITGKETARKMYGLSGWVAHHNTDIWRTSYPADNAVQYSFWPLGAGWLTSHLWEHYAFTADTTFLREEAYPLLKGASQFYADWLVENKEGYLVTPVGTSPENSFYYADGKTASASEGCTMDMAIIKENFERVIQVSEILNIDPDFRAELRQKYKQLLPYKIGAKGQLQEWQMDFKETNEHHRHLSHLYGFHPGNQITKNETPDLYKAVRKTLELRGDEATGWSMGWKINFWARMFDGNHAYKIINNLFRFVDASKEQKHGGLYANLFDAHPPFQIDGNFGYTAGVAEMLLQSHTSEIHLLPALPEAWSSGSISGLKARGNVEVDLKWKDGKLLEITLKSKFNQKVKLRYANSSIEKELKAGVPLQLNLKSFSKL